MKTLSDKHPIEIVDDLQKSIVDRKLFIEKLEGEFSNLDTTMNFKVNSILKSEFEQVCKKGHSNPSREIKLFMLEVVRRGRL